MSKNVITVPMQIHRLFSRSNNMNTSIKVGQVVQFNSTNFICLEDRGELVLILGKEGDLFVKKQVAKKNLLVSDKVPMVTVSHNNGTYLVSNKGTIISLKTYSVMKWGPENGDRRAILIQAKKQGMVFIKYTS